MEANDQVANGSNEQENVYEQNSIRSRRNSSSFESQSRDSSFSEHIEQEDLHMQLSSLANDVRSSVMGLSESVHSRLESFGDQLGHLQRHVNDLENRNVNSRVSTEHMLPPPINNNVRHRNETGTNEKHVDNSRSRVKPQLYDGLSDINEYLTQFNIIAEINYWNTETKALHLASSLTGNARSLLSEIDTEYRRDFSHLEKALQNRFGTVNRAEIYRVQLKNRMRLKNETIPELAQNIRKLTRQAYPDANSNLIDTLALDYFIDSLLDSETRLRLRECSPKSIHEAETLAVKMEAHRLADRQRSRNVASIGEIDKAENGSFSNEIRKLTETVGKLSDKVDNLKNQNGYRQPHFQDGDAHQNQVRYGQNRSQRPRRNFNDANRFRGGNWPRNNGQANQYGNRPRRGPEQGNENGSSLGTAARPARM